MYIQKSNKISNENKKKNTLHLECNKYNKKNHYFLENQKRKKKW